MRKLLVVAGAAVGVAAVTLRKLRERELSDAVWQEPRDL